MLRVVIKLLTYGKLLLLEDREESKDKGIRVGRNSNLSSGPKVSVVVVNYNGLRFLPKLLDSLQNQTYRNFEIIVVDNNSSDDSVKFIKNNYPKVAVVRLRKNYGYCQANNVGITCSKGQYIFFLNPDICLELDCLEHLVFTIRQRTDLAAVVPKIKLMDLPGFINGIGNYVPASGWGSDSFIGYVDINDFKNFSQQVEVFSACFGAALISRAALSKIGVLDKSFRFYYEDSDWSVRARLAGYKIVSNPRAVVYHAFNASMNKLDYHFKLKYLVANRLRFAWKNLSFRTALSFSRNYLREDLRNFLGSVRRRNLAMVLAYLLGWGKFAFSLPITFLKRRAIQSQRKDGLTDKQLLALLPNKFYKPLVDGCSRPILNSWAIRSVYWHLDGLKASSSELLDSSETLLKKRTMSN